ncbi:uncharacterized protein LOC116919284 [Daphnia magna]|uniref:uncharacterized protein LOC116919284 n=1 Tax=Daphnia magna TaxID=35525 RepID=UPI001E1BDA18|nr:uncharacterized protein LOC116919284 [Daphnia magna]
MEQPQPEDTIQQLLVHGPVYAVSKVIKTVLDSPITHVAAANKLHALFTQKEYVTDTTVDCFLSSFLMNVLKLPSSEEGKKTVFLEILDDVIFGNDDSFVLLLIARSLIQEKIPTETCADILCYLALKFHRQRNFQKFVTLLITAVKTSKHSLCGFSLHPRLLECMGECTVKLPITQNLNLLNLLCTVLEEDWTQNMDSEGDYPQPRVAAQVLGVLLLNIKLADYSIRDETMDDAIKIFSIVSERQKSLTEMALKNPKGFTSPLLTLAFAYGELHQLLLLYSPLYAERQSAKPECVVSDLQNDVWDFSFFHTYASKEQWLQLAELTLKSHIDFWAPLVLQKIRYLILFSGRDRNNKEKILKKLIGYLMEHFDCCQALWLNNIKYILPFMAKEQIGSLGKKISESPELWKNALSDPDITEKRTLQMSLVCAVFGSIHDHCRKRKAEEDTLALSSSTLSVLQLFSMRVDMWVGSVDRGNQKVSGWLRQSAEYLQESMRQVQSTTAEHDLTELLRPLDLLELLPLEYVLGPVHSGILMGLLSLLVSCTQEPIKSRLWMMIVRLLDTEKNSPIFEYFPCTDFMNWAVSNTKNLPDCALIFSTLFDEMLRSPKSSKNSFAWIQTADLSATALPVTILSMKRLIKHKKVDEEIFNIIRNRFLKTFENELEDRLIDVMEGAHCLLEMYKEHLTEAAKIPDAEKQEKTGKPQEIKELLQSLPKLLEAARKGLLSTDEAVGLSCARFLSLVLTLPAKHHGRDIKMSTWNAYRASLNSSRWDDRLLCQLIAKSNLKEFHVITNAMIDDLQAASVKALQEEDNPDEVACEVDIRRISCFFRHLVTADIPPKEDRFGVRLQVIQTVLPVIQHLILSVCRNYSNTSVDRVVRLGLPPMGIYLALLNKNDSEAYPHDITSSLHACLALPMNVEMSAEHFDSIFTVIYKTLHYLLTKHQEVAADRVPVLLQVYRRLMACTCSRSDSRRSAGDSEVACLTDSANRLARLASVINTQQLRYRRAAAYIIVDLLNDLKKQPLYPTVKQELTTALYHLMDLLDDHANRYLLSVLPSGIHELFRLEYEHFEKFYKFKGKV